MRRDVGASCQQKRDNVSNKVAAADTVEVPIDVVSRTTRQGLGPRTAETRLSMGKASSEIIGDAMGDLDRMVSHRRRLSKFKGREAAWTRERIVKA